MLEEQAQILHNHESTLGERFRALFVLRNLHSDAAVQEIARSLLDCRNGPLLKHEAAYVLGQMQRAIAIPVLSQTLQDIQQDSMVRHEAAEAMGAIKVREHHGVDVIALLMKYSQDTDVVVAQTCQLALCSFYDDTKPAKQYNSVDPALPYPLARYSTAQLRTQLLDTKQDLHARYRAMFTLRDLGTQEAVEALAAGLTANDKKDEALFRHEIAYVFGQMQHQASVPALMQSLNTLTESAMVRHECAEALGSIASTHADQALIKQLKSKTDDRDEVVRDSCIVALDMIQPFR